MSWIALLLLVISGNFEFPTSQWCPRQGQCRSLLLAALAQAAAQEIEFSTSVDVATVLATVRNRDRARQIQYTNALERSTVVG
jgi:hypothetical protein